MRNKVMREIQTFDPKRIKTRTVKPKAGKGGKTRPRNSNRKKIETGDVKD